MAFFREKAGAVRGDDRIRILHPRLGAHRFNGSISKVRIRVRIQLLKSTPRRSRRGRAASRARGRPPVARHRLPPARWGRPPPARRSSARYSASKAAIEPATRSAAGPSAETARPPARRAAAVEDLESEARVGPVVLHERGRSCSKSRRSPRLALLEQRLAFAEHSRATGVEPVVLHPHEGGAAAGGCRRARRRPGRSACACPRPVLHAQRPGPRAELRGTRQALRQPREAGQIEIDDVPAGDHVGIQLPDPRRQALEERLLRGAGTAPSGLLQPSA